MTPYRGKHRRTTTEEQARVTDLVDPGAPATPEVATTERPSHVDEDSAHAGRA